MENNMKWFLIDDDYDDQIIFEIAIKEVNSDIICVTAHNGLRALKMLMENHTFIPDIIFMDLYMPIMDGRECLKEMKKIKRLENIPIYIYSSPSEGTTVEELMALGAAGYIPKQSTIPGLVKALQQVLLFSHDAA